MFCYKITLAYDGSNYSGWQIQSNASSIQEHLQIAIRSFLGGLHVPVIGAGRTDAGVHALNQVAHFKIEFEFNSNRLLLALNGLLPPDLAIRSLVTTSCTGTRSGTSGTCPSTMRACR